MCSLRSSRAFIKLIRSPSSTALTPSNQRLLRTRGEELEGSGRTKEKEMVVSLGHSMSSPSTAESAITAGASVITHLFNAMLPFHHRDPGLVGLLTTLKLGQRQVFYGIIADGHHTDETVLRIAYKSNPKGIVLVMDAIAAMGLGEGLHQLGTMMVEVRNRAARLPGKETLAGSCSMMVECVREMIRATDCSHGEALLAASRHPAQALSLDGKKGSVERVGADADMVLLDSELNVQATCIAGDVVWTKSEDAFSKRIT